LPKKRFGDSKREGTYPTTAVSRIRSMLEKEVLLRRRRLGGVMNEPTNSSYVMCLVSPLFGKSPWCQGRLLKAGHHDGGSPGGGGGGTENIGNDKAIQQWCRKGRTR